MPKFKASEGFKMPGAPFTKKPVSTKNIPTSLENRQKGFQGVETIYDDGTKEKKLIKNVKKSKDKQVKDQSAPEYRSNIDEID